MRPLDEIYKELKGLEFPIGYNDSDELITSNLDEIYHLFVSGGSGTGKSVFLHSMLLTLIANNPPEKLRFILCDYKAVEFSTYNIFPHLLFSSIFEPQKIETVLQWTVDEINRRLKTIVEKGKTSLQGYNDKVWEEFGEELPKILIVVDDYAFLAERNPIIKESVLQILLRGRGAGVHLILVTQTPMAKTVKPLRSGFRSKILFSAASAAESRALLGVKGAELLALYGVALFGIGGKPPVHVKTIMATDVEFNSIAEQYRDLQPQEYIEPIPDKDSREDNTIEPEESTVDEMFNAAVEVIFETNYASVSILQRRLKLGYFRAASIVDQMEKLGIVGAFDNSNLRQLLITREQWNEMQGLVVDEPIITEENKVEEPTAEPVESEPAAPEQVETALKGEVSSSENITVNINPDEPKSSKLSKFIKSLKPAQISYPAKNELPKIVVKMLDKIFKKQN